MLGAYRRWFEFKLFVQQQFVLVQLQQFVILLVEYQQLVIEQQLFILVEQQLQLIFEQLVVLQRWLAGQHCNAPAVVGCSGREV